MCIYLFLYLIHRIGLVGYDLLLEPVWKRSDQLCSYDHGLSIVGCVGEELLIATFTKMSPESDKRVNRSAWRGSCGHTELGTNVDPIRHACDCHCYGVV